MKKLTALTLFLFSFCILLAQAPTWSRYVQSDSSKNSNKPYILDSKRTKDNGYILVGSLTSDTSNFPTVKQVVTQKQYSPRSTPWLVKTDSLGTKIWEASLSNYTNSLFSSVDTCQDGGYIVAGSKTVYYPYPQPQDSSQFLIAKYNNTGTLLWTKTYGGTKIDKANCIKQTRDGGYIVAGYTESFDGDVTGRKGGTDAWVLRLDQNGGIIWKNCYGKTGFDSAYAVIETTDNGFVIVGSTTSDFGYPAQNNGSVDGWVFKVSSSGTLVWQSCMGGTGIDVLKNVVLNKNGTYTVVGSTLSANVGGAINMGKADVWVSKIGDYNTIYFSKVFGGTQDDEALSVQETSDKGWLITGYSESNDGRVAANNGKADILLLRLSSAGNLVWQKCFGTGRDEFGVAGMTISDRDFVIAGFGQNGQKDVYDYPKYGGILAKFIGNYNTIKGTLFVDANSNGTKDVDESYFKEPLLVTSQKNDISTSNSSINGLFQNFVDTGVYTTTVNFNKPYYTISPSLKQSSFASYFNTDSFSFALQPLPNKQDLTINILPLNSARPGFSAIYRLFYENVGTSTISSGEISLTKDSRVSLISATPTVSSINGNTLKWSYTNLNPGDTASMLLSLQVAAPPTVNNNDSLSFLAVINPVQGDETPANDTAILKQVVVGSYDPNDKSESNGGSIPLSFVSNGDYLQYTIRFQNTGTDTAFNIMVRDTLSNRLDASTLQMVAASHPYTLTIDNSVNLAWRFDNILLPDSNRNEPASHGYLVYRIRPKSDLAKGEIVHNTAAIYFDFNLPVVTNDATTQVQSTLVVLPQGLLHFSGSQLGNQVKIFWQITEGTDLRYFEIERSEDGRTFNAIGTVIATQSGTDYRFTDIQSPNAIVYYRLKLVQANGNFRYSPVLLFQNRTENATSIVVYPNPLRTQGFTAFYSSEDGKAELQVLTAGGMLISKEQVVLAKGKNVFAISKTPVMPPGQYIFRVVNGGQVKSQTFIVQ